MTILNRPMFMNRGGLMRHDERTIRNVDDEIYRIAPRTHGTGAGRMDAREEYARDLREKAYLRNQMNNMAEGGPAMMPPMPMDPAMMAPPMPMDPAMMPPMPMDPAMMAPPPEVQVQMTENTAAQEGEMVGAGYLDGMMTGLDAAEDTAEVIDAIRGNDKPLQARYDELASLVGEDDASATPESVLALVQPTLMMTEQGAVDSGIGELMQGIAGEVEMETEMGQGVGELLMAQSAPEVVQQMNQGGYVQHFSDGTEVKTLTEQDIIDTFGPPKTISSNDRVRQGMLQYEKLYGDALGFGEEDAKLAKMQIYLDIANRGIALASGTNPNTGKEMSGSVLSQLAQVAQGAPQVYAQIGAQKRASERAIKEASLGQAIAEEGALKQSEYAQALRRSGDPALYNITDSEGVTTVVNSLTQAGQDAIAEAGNSGGVVTKVGTVTQPTQKSFQNLIVDGVVLGTINTSREENVDKNIKDMIAARLPEAVFEDTSFTLEDLDTTGLVEGTAEGIFETSRATDVVNFIDKGRESRVLRQQYGVLEELIDTGDFKQGAFAEGRKFFGEINNLLGKPLDIELINGVDAAAAFDALSNLVVAQTVSSLEGFRSTNAVMETIKRSGPQLSNSAEGNTLLISIANDTNDWRIELGKIATEYRDAGGSRKIIDGQTMDEKMDAFSEDFWKDREESLVNRIESVTKSPSDMAERLATAQKAADEAGQSIDDWLDGQDFFTQLAVQGAQKYRRARNANTDYIRRFSEVLPFPDAGNSNDPKQ